MKKIIVVSMFLITFAFGISPASAAGNHCTVQHGDSMWKIAQRYKVDFFKVLELNKHFVDQHLIHPKDKVYIPEHNTGTETTTHSDGDAHETENNTPEKSDASPQVQDVLNLVNAERKKAGIKGLSLSTKLTDIAHVKAEDMKEKNYFAHESPTYGSPFEMLQHFGVTYRTAGENIAAGQRSAEEVMNAWMNSSGHRANILNSSFTEIGIGYTKGGQYGTEWVQLFIGN